jgi:cleavage stimulation factor subunit 3
MGWCGQALPSCLLLHFAAADLEESRGNVEGARKIYEELVAGLLPAEPAADGEAPEEKPGLKVHPCILG